MNIRLLLTSFCILAGLAAVPETAMGYHSNRYAIRRVQPMYSAQYLGDASYPFAARKSVVQPRIILQVQYPVAQTDSGCLYRNAGGKCMIEQRVDTVYQPYGNYYHQPAPVYGNRYLDWERRLSGRYDDYFRYDRFNDYGRYNCFHFDDDDD